MRSMGKRAPLFLVSGAPGTGKTALIPHLAEHAEGLVVLDMDDLLEDGRHLGIPIATPSAATVWPAYNRLWLRLTGLIRRSGIAVLLLCPLLPPEVGAAGIDFDDGTVHWALLDCAPAEQARRLRDRGWTGAEIDDAIQDAEQARKQITPAFRTDLARPEATARDVLAWATERRRPRL
jgi:hypothetical protein